MNVAEAHQVLGVSHETPWVDVRQAYRRLMRTSHPDRAGAAATAQAAKITEAFASLRAERDGLPLSAARRRPGAAPRPRPAPRPTSRAQASRPGQAGRDSRRRPSPSPFAAGAATGGPVAVVDSDTIAVAASAEDAFMLLLDAAHDIGEVSYVDADLGLLETIVRFEGTPVCSLVVSLQGRAHHIDAFCTVESLEAVPAPPIAAVVEVFADLARQRAGQRLDRPVQAPPGWLGERPASGDR